MQIKGWIITNGCLKTAHFHEICEMYQEAANTLGIELTHLYNDEIIMGIEEDTLFVKGAKITRWPDFVLFLDKDICLAKQLEDKGLRLFNTSEVIRWCDDKGLTFQKLAGAGIKMPKTIIAPMYYFAPKEEQTEYIAQLEKILGYPMIVKESFGSFGEQVYLVHHIEELKTIRQQLIARPHIYQEYIHTSIGRDARLNVVGGKVVASMERFSYTSFKANVAQGGQTKPFTPPESFINMAIKVCDILGADFAGVDILFGENNTPILCEVNSNAHIKGIQKCTGINVAVPILEHIRDTITK